MAQGVRTIFSIAFGKKGSKRELDNHKFERNFLNFHVLAMHKTSSSAMFSNVAPGNGGTSSSSCQN